MSKALLFFPLEVVSIFWSAS